MPFDQILGYGLYGLAYLLEALRYVPLVFAVAILASYAYRTLRK